MMFLCNERNKAVCFSLEVSRTGSAGRISHLGCLWICQEGLENRDKKKATISLQLSPIRC